MGANHGSYLTALLGINDRNNMLVLDCGPKEDLNQRLLNAAKVTFNTDYNGIKVSFSLTELKKITYKGESAFAASIPKSLFWMQRREYFRVKSPLSKPSYCQLVIEGKEPVNLKLYDISLTGFAMLNVSKEVSDFLTPGKILEQCKLILSEAGECMTSFEVCAKYIINPDKLQKIQKVGCRFVKVTRPVEETVQRYMQQIQREDLQSE